MTRSCSKNSQKWSSSCRSFERARQPFELSAAHAMGFFRAKPRPVEPDTIKDPVLRDLHGTGRVRDSITSSVEASPSKTRTKTRRPSVAQLMENNSGRVRALSQQKDDDPPPPAAEETSPSPSPTPKRAPRTKVRRKSLEEIQKLGRASSQDNHFVRQDSIKRQSILRPESRDDDDAVDFEVDDAAAATEPPKPPTPPTPPAPTLQPSPRSVIPAAAPAKEAPATPKEAPSVVAATRPPREAKPAVAASKPAAAVQAEPSTVLHVALGMVLVLAAAFVSSALKELFA